MRSPVRWFGGKGQMTHKLLPLLPAHQTYVEPFGGGASLLFAKVPAPVEVYNDVDSGIVNFYRVLRNPAMYAEFVRLVSLTPWSREEWHAAHENWRAYTDPIERAWGWFIEVRQAFGGSAGTKWGSWQMSITDSARGMSSAINSWLSALEGLPAVHARLQSVQIEHQDWRYILRQYDTPATLFYCDPPYVPDTRGRKRYYCELEETDHVDLVATLLRLEGMALLSGYAHPVYAPLEAAGWRRYEHEVPIHAHVTTGEKARRTECVWISPNAEHYGPLFS